MSPHFTTFTTIQFTILQPGFLNFILRQMAEIATKMKPSERVVSLVFDEMSIKKHLDYSKARDTIDGLTPKGEVANQAMVLMARGAASKWKQVSRQSISAVSKTHMKTP